MIRKIPTHRLRADLQEFRRDWHLLLKLAMCVYDDRTAAMMDARIQEYRVAIGNIEQELEKRRCPLHPDAARTNQRIRNRITRKL